MSCSGSAGARHFRVDMRPASIREGMRMLCHCETYWEMPCPYYYYTGQHVTYLTELHYYGIMSK
jgi:hypothetical protein